MAKAENKTKANAASVDDFLNAVEDEQKRKDSFVLKEMMERISGAPARMWGPSIVGFGEYHYKYDSGREGDFLVVGFSPRAQNLSIYIMPGYQDYSDMMDRLGKHKTGKSCLYIKRLSDVDMDVLEELITAGVNDMADKRTDL